MLRVLHTSDWHLGHALHGVERAWEHDRFLAWLLDAVEEQQVDAVLIAGDVFDAANPPAAAQEAWCRFLAEAWRRVRHLQVVVVGGNHDSAARLEVNDPLLRALGRLHVIGGVSRREGTFDVERLLVRLEDRAGAVAAWVAAVPFLRPSETGAGGDDAVARATRRLYGEVLDAARRRRSPGQALLAMGHLYMAGGRTSELSERKLAVGDQSAVPADVFPEDLAYVALGHLHLAQAVGGRETVRYAGSPLPLSLKERTYRHQVVLVDLEGERVRAWRPLRVPRAVELLRVPDGDGAAPVEEVVHALRRLPPRTGGADAARPLLEVCVKVARPEPALRQTIESALEGKEARLVRLGVEQAGTGRVLGEGERRAVAELQPEEVFRRKYEKDFGGAPPVELLEAFHQLLHEVLQEGA